MTARTTLFQAGRLAFFALLIVITTVLPADAADRAKLERAATAVMGKLYQKYPDAKKLEQKAVAVLVFPEVYKAGLMIGAETGDGVMRIKGKTVDYYNTSGYHSSIFNWNLYCNAPFRIFNQHIYSFSNNTSYWFSCG